MRVTQHSGRKHRNGGAYSSKHNDRNFGTKADNIEFSKTKKNLCWNWCEDDNLSFDESELKFYQENYQSQLDKTNETYIANRHKERVTTLDKWRKQVKHAPEEMILQIGKVGERPDLKLFKTCFEEYLTELNAWNKKNGNHMHILNWSLHQDELGAPHIHLRRVWDYYNEKTQQIEIGQEKALTQAGVELPRPNEKESRTNNRKITFDTLMRKHWIEIAKKNGLEIETEPLPKNEVGLPLEEKIRREEKKRNKLNLEAENKLEKVNKKIAEEAEEVFKVYQEKREGFLKGKSTERIKSYQLPQTKTLESANHYKARIQPEIDALKESGTIFEQEYWKQNDRNNKEKIEITQNQRKKDQTTENYIDSQNHKINTLQTSLNALQTKYNALVRKWNQPKELEQRQKELEQSKNYKGLER